MKAARPARFPNSRAGEATGGHEWGFLDALARAGFAAHRVQPLKAKHFMRSLG